MILEILALYGVYKLGSSDKKIKSEPAERHFRAARRYKKLVKQQKKT